MYLSDLRNHHHVVEILTVYRDGEEIAMASRLSIKPLPGMGEVILFEGIETPAAQGLKASRSATYQRKNRDFMRASSRLIPRQCYLLIRPAMG